MDEKSQRDDFIYDMRVMRATRFNFSKRLEKRSKVKAFTVNILSVISIFVSVYLLANASGISEVELKKISVTIIGLSLLALWMSLDTPSPELLRKANDAHQCGREISEIYRAFKYEMINISDAAKKYEAVISKYSENHDQLDRAKTLYDDREKHPRKANGLTKYNTTWLHWVSSYSPALLAFSCCVAIFIFQLVFPM
ncbi:SLATT domain-containing protein [Tritonibacter mobilis]|uniref:SLATT domain-containing protein n=1 Tax=Tritonibacter mobilis TaxID=379347 RepID=UPI001C08445E|nr:SLATT domain-containing protein [Tritonibacter mobilis]MBU3034252.1 SLATT domain-containing protein [Tritonibacter mobilis]WHQ84309.1 SLATT domain-containing protein [Tritonibacter mobilis]